MKERNFTVPASVFLEASKYGLAIAKKGIQKKNRGELYWHDPWGIREALLYSLQNACAALGCCNASYARWLKVEAKMFARYLRASYRSATRILDAATDKTWVKHLESKRLFFYNRGQLNRIGDVLEEDCGMASTLELSDGSHMPRLGFGTAIFDKNCACERGRRCQACADMTDTLQAAVTTAVKNGYRHFDCAQCYNNEEVIGKALKASGVPRNKLFLASKLSHKEDYGALATPKLVQKQLQKLKTGYLDLYYLHDDIGDVRKEKAAWQALERLQKQGVIKHLGLSNYRTEAIKRIMKYARVLPSVLQVKYDVYHPGYQWAEDGIDNIVAFAQLHGIAVVGYATFSGWPSLLQARDDPHVCSVAQRYGRTPVQVLLRHGLQKGLALIPASVNEAHIQSNTKVFDFSLSECDVCHLDSLANLAASRHVPWIP